MMFYSMLGFYTKSMGAFTLHYDPTLYVVMMFSTLGSYFKSMGALTPMMYSTLLWLYI